MITHILTYLFIGLFILGLVNCGGDELQTPATVREYALMVCNPEILLDGATWKQARDGLQGILDKAENVIAPDELFDYHFASMALLRSFIDYMKTKDLNARANPAEMATDDGILRMMFIMEEAGDELSYDTIRTLVRHGCVVE